MNANQAAYRKNILILEIILHLLYVFACLVYYQALSAYVAVLAITLVFSAALVLGKYFGFVSGFVTAAVRILAVLKNQTLDFNTFWSDILAILSSPEGLISILLPVLGFLAGFFAEKFSVRNSILEQDLQNLLQSNIAYKSEVRHYQDRFQDLSQTKLYHHAWESWLEDNNLNDQLVSVLLVYLARNRSEQEATDLVQSLFSQKENDANLRLFDLLIQIKPDVLAVMHLDGTIIHYNTKMMAIYGYSAKENLENTNLLQYLLPDAMEMAADNIGRATRSELNRYEKYGMRSQDHGFANLLISPEISLDCLGNPMTLVACVEDQTSHYENAGPLNLALINETNICCLAADRSITYISPMVADILDELNSDILSEKMDRFIHRKHQERFVSLTQTCQNGRMASAEIEMLPVKGKRIIFNMNIFPSIGHSGGLLGMICLLEDITALIQAEEAMQHRLYIEKLISGVSTRFISINADEMENEIKSVLKKIGDFEEANESSVEIIQSGRISKPVRYHVINERNQIRSLNAASRDIDRYETISIPIIVDAELMGSFVFYQEKYRNNWMEADLELIRLIGEIIINALIRKGNELSIRLNERWLSTTLHTVDEAVIATNSNGQIILMNRMAEILTGWRIADALQHPLSDVFKPETGSFFRHKNPDDEEMTYSVDDETCLSLTSLDGKQYYIALNQTKIEDPMKDVNGDVTIFRDITKEKQENDEIRYISYHDKLTGLYNRAFFEVEMERLNTRRQYPITLILGDCNGLKIANDIFGHLEGDRLLQAIARILRKVTRKEDIVARWGGDEFAIILPHTDEQAAAEMRERILQLCAEAENCPIKPSLALGSATNMDSSEDLVELLKLAEDRMYRHKLREGRSARSALLRSIEKMIYEKSYETEEHANRITSISQKIGQAIGLSEYELEELSLLSSLHDIGKIGIPDNILQKPSQLSMEEWEIMKEHAEKGYNLAKSTPELTSIADSILHHHEHWDGTGYPSGLQGEKIPKLSRILSIIDAYDVITHSRAYKLAQTSEEALKEIENCAGSQFDPELTRIFINIMRERKEEL